MKNEFKIDNNGLGWYIEKKETSYFLHTDGKLHDWSEKEHRGIVYFQSKPEAERALKEFLRKPKRVRTKLAPSAKQKVDKIVGRIRESLEKLSAALKELQ